MSRVFLGLGLLFMLGCAASESKVDPVLNEQLIEAIQNNNPGLVDSLLVAGADPNARNDQGTPVLILSATRQQEKAVASLLRHGADVNARRENEYYSTALMEIAPTNNLAIARLLLENRANVNQLDSLGDTAINWAAYHGRLALVDLLIQTGARIDVTGAQGSALDIAIKQWHDQVAEYLIAKGAGQPLRGEIAENLVKAVKAENEIQLLEALQAGGNANQKDEAGTPLIVIAASRGNLTLLDILLDSGADANAQNRVGQTALSRAAYFGHQTVIDQLLSAGADPELTGEKYGMNPLLSATIGGHEAIGRKLIDKGVNVDVQDGVNGFTPLMFATAYGHVEFVKLLIEANANPYIKTKDGTGLYDLLSYSRNSEIRALLEEYVLKQ
ncbi:MAG: UNC-44 ankyrin [Saprospiraceae bacterium]|nr:MAG: UNC-44 ankyrin [Saprospiraceae bacterium]